MVDASAAIGVVTGRRQPREAFGDDDLHALHLVDSEIASTLRRLVFAGLISAGEGRTGLAGWSAIAVERYPATPLLGRIWELRESLSANDAGYVALAEVLDCPLVTADARISGAPGIRCPVTVVPR